jgi:hypothetical protein
LDPACARAIAAAWAAGERDRAAELFSDELFDRFFLHGDAAAIRSRIDEYRAAGVTTPTLMPLSLAGSAEERAERLESQKARSTVLRPPVRLDAFRQRLSRTAVVRHP